MKCNKYSNLHKVISYSFVGIIGTLIHFSTLVILVEAFKIDPLLSSGIGFILTVILSFVLNMKYTFKIKNRKKAHLFIKYLTTSIIGLMLNNCIMYYFVRILSLHYSIGQAVVVICIPIINFLINNYWTFK